jgi:hypothetical protein
MVAGIIPPEEIEGGGAVIPRESVPGAVGDEGSSYVPDAAIQEPF